MANYHKRNSIRAVQWDPENAQSFEGIKKLIAENPGIGWKADNIVRNDASDNIIIRSFGMIVLRIKPYEYLVEGKKDSLFTVSPETFELKYKLFAATEKQFDQPFSYADFGTRLEEATHGYVKYDKSMIVSKDETTVNRIADMLDSMGFDAVTGYFNPEYRIFRP